MTLPVLLIVALLLLGFVLVRRRRRAVTVPPGPRTVAELVRQRAAANTGALPLEPAALTPAMEAPTEEIHPAPVEHVAEHVTVEPATAEPATAEPAAAEPATAEPATAEPEPAPVAPLADDVPWRRATQLNSSSATETPPAPADAPGESATAEYVTAEHAATDLALLRTFGPIEPDAGLDPTAVVALEAPAQPDVAPESGAAQDLRVRTLRHDGTPVVDAAMALLDHRGREASSGRSDVRGAGELGVPHPGSYVLVATAPDHQPGAVALTVADAPVDCDVLLVRSAVLVGIVTGEDEPIVGAEVTLVQDGDVVESTDTDAEGRFRIADLPAGEYVVSVAAAGCEPDVDLVCIPDEAEQVHDVDLVPGRVPAG